MENIFEMEIIDLTDEGSAVGKVEGLTVFTDKGIVADIVKAKIVKKKKNYILAKTIQILKKSKKRCDKKICDIQDICGGCELLDMKYEEQLKLKKEIVTQKLIRLGDIKNPVVKDTIGMDRPYHYRNKSVMPISLDNKKVENNFAKEDIKIGFYKRKTHEIVPFTDCKIQDTVNNKIVDIVKAFVVKNKISIYDEKTGKGVFRHIITKISHYNTDIMLILVTNSKKTLEVNYLIKEFKEKNIPVKTIVQNINTKNTNVILSNESITLYGDGFITDEIDKVYFNIYPVSFFQVNYTQMKKLYNKAFEYADLQTSDVVYDLYSGIGTISLLMAKKVSQVYGVEVVQEAVKSAKNNAVKNNITNAEFIAGKVEDKMQELMNNSKRPNKIVLDPARKGCEQSVLEKLIQIEPEKIVYISCNPSTLARDLKILLTSGKYELKEVTPCDMFPNTMGIEAVAYLSRK